MSFLIGHWGIFIEFIKCNIEFPYWILVIYTCWDEWKMFWILFWFVTRSDAPTEFQRSRSWASPYIIFMWSACISESLVFPRSIHSWRNNLNGPIVVHLPKAYLVTKLLFLVKSWDFQFEITKETATSLKLSLCFRKLLVLKPFHSTFHCDEWVSRANEKRHSVTGSKSFI